jgi:hypothetical protein
MQLFVFNIFYLESFLDIKMTPISWSRFRSKTAPTNWNRFGPKRLKTVLVILVKMTLIAVVLFINDFNDI